MAQEPQPQGRGQRKLRNLLIDKHIQYRFIITSMLIILVSCVCLGFLLHLQNLEAQRFFSRQRAKSTALFRRQLKENTQIIAKLRKESTARLQKVLETATGMLDVQLKDKDPATREMAKLAKQSLEKDDRARLARRKKYDAMLIQKRLANDAEQSKQRKHQDLQAALVRKGQNEATLVYLGLFSVLMLCLIFLFTVVLTHRVVGPLFKIGRYFDEIAEGRLGVLHSLRKGDLIHTFYARFKNMHQKLSEQARGEIQQLQAILDEAGDELDEPLRQKLEALLEARQMAIADQEAEG